MSNKYKFYEPSALYFVTYTVVDWIDLFTRDAYRHILLDSLQHCIIHKGLAVYGWCLMTNHVHLLMQARAAHPPQDILRDHKRHTSEKLRAALAVPGESRREWITERFARAGSANSNNRGFQLWQQDNHPIELWSREAILEKLDYIHLNPVRAGFVTEPQALLWSSARAYAGMESRLGGLSFLDIDRRTGRDPVSAA